MEKYPLCATLSNLHAVCTGSPVCSTTAQAAITLFFETMFLNSTKLVKLTRPAGWQNPGDPPVSASWQWDRNIQMPPHSDLTY